MFSTGHSSQYTVLHLISLHLLCSYETFRQKHIQLALINTFMFPVCSLCIEHVHCLHIIVVCVFSIAIFFCIHWSHSWMCLHIDTNTFQKHLKYVHDVHMSLSCTVSVIKNHLFFFLCYREACCRQYEMGWVDNFFNLLQTLGIII